MNEEPKKKIFGPDPNDRLVPPAGRQATYRFAGFDPKTDVDLTTGRLAAGPTCFEARSIIRIYPPRFLTYAGVQISRITTHYKVAGYLRAVLGEIDQAGHWSAIEAYGGGFEPRLIRGGTDWSLHTLGLAWDFDPARNPLGAKPEATYLGSTTEGRWVVDCFAAWGFLWGGRFQDRKDCQHFQFATGV
jgi:hypothetical protein